MGIGNIITTVLPWVLLALACNAIIKAILYFDLNKRAYNHVPGPCHSIAGVEDGAEDVELLPGGMVLATAGLRYYDAPELNATKGKVYLYNISGNSAWELTINSKRLKMKYFNPHGLSSWTGKNGKTTVYIVNHHPKGDRVDVFTLDKANHALNHTKSIRDKRLMHSLHDVVAIGTDKLYLSNFHYFNTNQTWGQTAELAFALSVGDVIFCNGVNCTSVVSWLRSPNGLALDSSRRFIYIASTLSSAIEIFKINSYQNGSLSFYDKIDLNSAPVKVFSDNVKGHLWVSAHPVKYRYFLHETKPKTMISPSQVIRLKGKVTRKVWEGYEVFSSDGATLSAASSVIRYKEHIMIGSLHDKLLKCDLQFPELYD